MLNRRIVCLVISCAAGCSAAHTFHAAAGSGGSTSSVGSGGAGSGGAGGAGGGVTLNVSDAGPVGDTWSPSGPDPVVSVSPHSLYETDSAVLGFEPGPVTVAWTAATVGSGSFIGYTVSTDGGQTFHPPSTLASPGGRSGKTPALINDVGDRAHIVWLGFQPAAGGGVADTHVYTAAAVGGPGAFGPPVEVTDPADTTTIYDSPGITLTTALGLLVTYAYAGPAGRGIVAASSADDGATWTRTVVVSDPTSTTSFDLPYVQVDQFNGSVYLAYLERDTGTDAMSVVLRWSPDAGISWPPTDAMVVSQPGDPVAFTAPNVLVNTSPAAPGSTVPPPSYTWVSYGLSDDPLVENVEQKLSDIEIAYSIDGTLVASNSILGWSAGIFALSPRLVTDYTGAQNLVYYVGAADEDPAGSFRWAIDPYWHDELLMPVTVKQPLVFEASLTDPRSVGRYSGISGGKSSFYATYTDNSSGASHVAVHRVALPHY